MQIPLTKRFKLKHLFLAGVIASLLACTTTTEKKESSDVYMQLGVRYLNMNKLELAKENLEKAVAADSGNLQAHNALAFLYEKIEKYPLAQEHYQKALSINPDDLGIQNNYGRFLCERGEMEKGLALLNKALGNLLNDRAWLALTNAGICQIRMGNRSAAKTYFKQALLLNDAYAPALLEMLKISYLNKAYWPAKGFLQRYVQVANHNAESLWYAMQTEVAIGNPGQARVYQNLLLEKFPFSKEAKQFGAVKN
ncbi:type IV pilus biogenesis/stability protein PilW [Methylosoma difficile]